MTKINKPNKPKNYITTVIYRDHEIDVLLDDYGQQFYFYLDDEEIGCGTYNSDYEGCIQYYIDRKLDHIEYIRNEKPHHPSAEIRWEFNQETGERKKVIFYDGIMKELETQDGDYKKEVQQIMDTIDKEYDDSHQTDNPRNYISDLLNDEN